MKLFNLFVVAVSFISTTLAANDYQITWYGCPRNCSSQKNSSCNIPTWPTHSGGTKYFCALVSYIIFIFFFFFFYFINVYIIIIYKLLLFLLLFLFIHKRVHIFHITIVTVVKELLLCLLMDKSKWVCFNNLFFYK